MKKQFLKIFPSIVLLLITVHHIEAKTQYDDLLTKTKKNSAFTIAQKPIIDSAFDFIPADSVIFSDNFTGNMSKNWKSNGLGKVITLPGIDGKWLTLQNFCSYKLTNPHSLPAKFTIEFDIVASADKTEDLSPVIFGFAKDNSVSQYVPDAYNAGGINAVSIRYSNGDEVNIASSATNFDASTKLDLVSYANQIMHVSIAVDGDRMRVYLDKAKVANALLFNKNRVKYFFLSAPIKSDNKSKVVVSNFKIATYKSQSK
ncbi:hypothetical protein SAMN05421821_104172 [Mucilaginibacter lappiensis]|uniref:Uncharacterized protein n=1 Tax=Mucilaginibacter lappiensis TaxID=354630 RepID=A0ABR6PIE3_9SPHI|nr:hypothetical protein [Mucilaginibacter lappiensis]MBB6109416.1 hypothetical protein [Mucilaginibacter lappiensis]SIQ96379.1 hypothetical protein SAMN05421821_104172 [Mucilaginibacter lappiensis]